MIIKLTSAARKHNKDAPDKFVYINTRYLLKMGRNNGPAQSDQDPFLYPHTQINMAGTPDVVVLQDCDTIMFMANPAVTVNG